MSTFQKSFILFCLILGLSLGAMIAQQQQSGGSGGGAVTQSGNWLMRLLDGSGNSITSTTGALDVNLKSSGATQSVSGTVSVNALPAGTNIIGKEVPITACGTTVFSQAYVALPTSSTAVTTTTTCVYAISISNTNASPQTVTITDNQGTPINIVGPAYSIPGLSQVTFPFNGVQFTSGIKWTAGGTGVTGAVLGVQ